ncbi:MAG TPA: Ig-like domain-containing protein [Gemmatimonadales bacterium]|nr:Ig-like domain-containing protein [Gemmatimonadales bacterium]
MRAAVLTSIVASIMPLIAASCSNSTGFYTGAQTATVLESVAPAGGATGVSPTASVVVTFSSSTRSGMELFVSLHQGSVTGASIAHTATWSPDHSTLILLPSPPLQAGKQYTVHIGGGILDKFGNAVDMSQNGLNLGGLWATPALMNGSGETTFGWLGSNGDYGLLFTFST